MPVRIYILQRYVEIALMSIGLLAHVGFLLKLIKSESQENKIDRKIKFEAITLIKEALRLTRIAGGNFQFSLIENGASANSGTENNKELLIEIKNSAQTISNDLQETLEIVETALAQLIGTPTCGRAWSQEWRRAFDELHTSTRKAMNSIQKALDEVQNFPFMHPN